MSSGMRRPELRLAAPRRSEPPRLRAALGFDESRAARGSIRAGTGWPDSNSSAMKGSAAAVQFGRKSRGSPQSASSSFTSIKSPPQSSVPLTTPPNPPGTCGLADALSVDVRDSVAAAPFVAGVATLETDCDESRRSMGAAISADESCRASNVSLERTREDFVDLLTFFETLANAQPAKAPAAPAAFVARPGWVWLAAWRAGDCCAVSGRTVSGWTTMRVSTDDGAGEYGPRTMLAVKVSHFLTNMSIALNAWSRTLLREERASFHQLIAPTRAQTDARSLDSLLSVDQADAHRRDHLACQVLLLEHLASRHQRHQSRDPGMYKRISERARKRGDEHFALRRGLEVAREAREEDAGVGADTGFDVGLRLGEDAEEVVVEDAVVELCVKRAPMKTEPVSAS